MVVAPKRALCREAGNLAGLSQTLQVFEEENNSCYSYCISSYTSLLQQIGDAKDLSEGKLVHKHIVKHGYSRNAFVNNHLIQMYGKCGDLENASTLFNNLSSKSVNSWNFLISAYAQHGYPSEAFNLYKKMESQGYKADVYTYSRVLEVCSSPDALQMGKAIHASILANGTRLNIVVYNSLMKMYAKCGSNEQAWLLFNKMPQRDIVSWNTMISGYAHNGEFGKALELLEAMDLKPDRITFTTIIGSCSSFDEGKRVHERAISAGFGTCVTVQNALLNMYVRCGHLQLARELFDALDHKSIISWNVMITGYNQSGHMREAQNIHWLMNLEGVRPDYVTLISILPSCCTLKDVKAIHALAVSCGFQTNVVVLNCLVTAYSRFQDLLNATEVFESISMKDVISWTAMMEAFVQVGQFSKCMEVFQKMQTQGIQPDAKAYVTALGGCKNVEEGKAIEEKVISSGLKSSLIIQNALLSMYADCGCILEARKVFESIQSKSATAWNTIITAYAQQGYPMDALDMYKMMERESVEPESNTFAVLLGVCTELRDVEMGRYVHSRIVASRDERENAIVQNALVNMYAKCGHLEYARFIFDRMVQKTKVSWTTMISAYARLGYPSKALVMIYDMCLDGLQPNEVTFTSSLLACSHGGLVEEGHKCFLSILNDHGQQPTNEHYACMVDLLGRAGWLQDAEELLLQQEELRQDPAVWRSLLSASKTYRDKKHGQRAADRVIELDPDDGASYMLLSNIKGLAIV